MLYLKVEAILGYVNASGKIEENTAKLSVNIFLTFKWKGYGHEFNVPKGHKDETEAPFDSVFHFNTSTLDLCPIYATTLIKKGRVGQG